MKWGDLIEKQESLWYLANDGDTVIVFLHGIHSNNKKTWAHHPWWTRPATSGIRRISKGLLPSLSRILPFNFWPDLVLADPIFKDPKGQSPSIYLASYYSSIDAGRFGIDRCAESVFRDLQRDKVLDKSNIVFVGHSMGGIIARRILGEHWVEFESKRVGIVLMASPSGGSGYANDASYLTKAYDHRQAEQLQKDSPLLAEIHDKFEPLVTGHHVTGAEAFEHRFYIHVKAIPALNNVVPVESAERYFIPATFLPNTTHSTCVQPRNSKDKIHQVLQDFWSRYTNFVPRHHLNESDGLRETNRFFTGREQLFDRIYDHLQASQAVLLHGPGGVGKTSLALEYANRNPDQYAKPYVLPCESETVMFAHLAHWAGATPDATATPKEVEAAAKKGVELMAQGNHNLVILDNADEQLESPFFRSMLAQLSAHHVIVTSRPNHHLGGTPSIEVDVLEPEVGGLLFYRQWKKQPNAQWIALPQADKDLCLAMNEELAGLPLALEQAGVMAATIDPIQLLKEYREIGAARRELYQQAPEFHRHLSLWKTVQVALRQLSEPAQTLVQLCAFMDADAIDLRLFDEWKMELPEILEQAKQREEWLKVRTEALRSVLIGMVTEPDPYSASGKNRSRFTMHRAFQGVVREIAGDAVGDHESAKAVLAEWWWWGAGQAAFAMLTFGRFRDGLPHCQLAYRERVALLGNFHVEVTRDLNNLAQFYQDTNQLGDAESIMRKALAIDEKKLGAYHPDVARDLNNLAQLLQTIDQLAEAEPLMRRSLEINERRFGPDHPNVARDLFNIATLLQATKRFVEAEPLMRRALHISEQSLGKDHPSIANMLSGLAFTLRASERFTEAETLVRRALEIEERNFGPDHPDVARHINNLATLLLATSRLKEAEVLMRRSVNICEKAFGPEHPNVATSLNNLAMTIRSQSANRFKEVEILIRRALEIDVRSYGPDHSKVAIRLNNLAGLLQDNNQLADAVPLNRRSLVILTRFQITNGHQHPSYNTWLGNYIDILQALGRTEDEIKAEIDAIYREAKLAY